MTSGLGLIVRVHARYKRTAQCTLLHDSVGPHLHVSKVMNLYKPIIISGLNSL